MPTLTITDVAALSTSLPPGRRDLALVTGADIVVRVLEELGVEVCFGMPGGAMLPVYDALARGTTVRHVLVRHEQGAGHMAEGYARASGGPGVVLATSGPGATNLVTPIADARMDSVPLVCITGQVRSDLIGTDAFQECDIVAVTRPLVKFGVQVRDADEIATALRDAFCAAMTGRPGPVLVDIPRDVQEAAASLSRPAPPVRAVRPEVDPGAVAAAADLLAGASRPILYVGGGAQGCAGRLLALAERTGIPAVTTLMGKGAFPESHRLFAGWPGMHGTKYGNLALNHADVIVAAGARFDDRVTGRLSDFAPDAKVVHIDIDPREHGKIRAPDIAIHADLGDALVALSQALGERRPSVAQWHAEIHRWKRAHPLRYAPAERGAAMKPQDAVRVLDQVARGHDDVIWTTGVGQHQMWAMQYLQVEHPRSFISSGGLGTMGFGLPAAIGARAARRDAAVVCIDGDGSFMMTLQELATAVAERLPVITVVLNNGRLGMVSQWQSQFFDRRLSASDLDSNAPDLAAVARALGGRGVRVRRAGELAAAFGEALRTKVPTVLDVRVDGDEHCFPMILPGGAAIDQVEWAPE